EDPHNDVPLTPLLVHVLRVEREREVMDLLGVEAHALAARRHHSAPEPCGGGPAPVPVALIIDAELRVGLGVPPPRIAFDRHAGGPDALALGGGWRPVVR